MGLIKNKLKTTTDDVIDTGSGMVNKVRNSVVGNVARGISSGVKDIGSLVVDSVYALNKTIKKFSQNTILIEKRVNSLKERIKVINSEKNEVLDIIERKEVMIPESFRKIKKNIENALKFDENKYYDIKDIE